jgi:predicted dienelactone hydrolase
VEANAGLRRDTLVVHGDEACAVLAFYPTYEDEQPTRLGAFTLDVAPGAPAMPERVPLVVLSHGSGGAPLTHRNLARHLARAGHIVVLPTHPGNNREDNALAGSAALLARRPAEISAVIDWAMSGPGFGEYVQPDGVGIVGHSLGGYTALALAGGQPRSFPNESPDHVARPVNVTADPRVAAAVLLAPATVWFMGEGALAAVRVPILMYTGGSDAQAPAAHGAIVERGMAGSGLLTHRIVEGAGHYSFFSPYPSGMVSPSLAPSQDPPGFDRAAFHATLYPEITTFFQRHLGSSIQAFARGAPDAP